MGTDRTEGLRFLRLDRGLSARALAVKAGVSHGQILRAERTRRITPGLAKALADALGVTVDAVLWPETPPIVRERIRRGMRLGAAADYCGVPIGVLSRAERGREIRPHYAKQIADAYGLRVTEVLRESAA
jgi:transcriptional regulator with XRE-family HTH domain